MTARNASTSPRQSTSAGQARGPKHGDNRQVGRSDFLMLPIVLFEPEIPTDVC